MIAELATHVALVTGAGRGIGRATALRLAQAGCDLALIARTESELEVVAAAASSSGVRARALPADITDDVQVECMVQRAFSELGQISILINSAGSAPPRTTINKMRVADVDRTLATCLRAPIVLSRLLLPSMLAQQRGAIVNVASSTHRSAPRGEAVYAAAKAGLIAFSRALFAETRHCGIKVAAICPGYVDTGFVPPNRRVDRTKFLRPEDVAGIIFQVLTSGPRLCPTEVILEPQFDPERVA
jgi:3-oxoacyl-[acyl-carrier protein] reductase